MRLLSRYLFLAALVLAGVCVWVASRYSFWEAWPAWILGAFFLAFPAGLTFIDDVRPDQQ